MKEIISGRNGGGEEGLSGFDEWQVIAVDTSILVPVMKGDLSEILFLRDKTSFWRWRAVRSMVCWNCWFEGSWSEILELVVCFWSRSRQTRS